MDRERDALSLWWSTLENHGPARPPLDGDVTVDVAIVGGGFTGLWTAREILRREPSCSVLVVEAETCGFGASGRNGGWASALFAESDAAIERHHGRSAALAMRRTMQRSVAELGTAADADGIDCDFVHAGTVTLATTPVQLDRARAAVDAATRFTGRDDDLVLLGADEVATSVRSPKALGGTYTPHCATIHPAKLVRGLAEAVERHGGRIVEGTSVVELVPGSPATKPTLRTSRGTVTATTVVRATEAWTSTFRASRRLVAPIYSLMVATEPLDEATWASIGLDRRPTFADERHLIVYGQRTADGRLAFGGRGAPYHLGSAIDPRFDRDERVASALRSTLCDLFPILDGVAFTHHWGGPLGVPRDWTSSVTSDRTTGMAAAGGYVGDGVTTSFLAGQTLADLIVGLDTERTHLPWVGHRSRSWEPEPLRYLGINAGLVVAAVGDRSEARTGRPSRVAGALDRLLRG